TSAHSRVDATGRIADFHNPRIEATYHATVDLFEAATLTHMREVRKGLLQLDGRGNWTAQDFSSKGKLMLKDFGWHDDELTLQDASLASDFSANRQQVRLSKMQGRLLGGSAIGDFELANWFSPPFESPRSAKEKKPKPPEPKASLHLKVNDISSHAVADAIGTPTHPFHRMNVVGTITGTL